MTTTRAYSVELWIYDLTQGMAAAFSPMLLGKTIEGVWHSAVVYDGRAEIFFGAGITKARPGSTPYGAPRRVIDLGTTEVDPQMLDQLLGDLAPRYTQQTYNLLSHNCNHFCEELALLLTGAGELFPDYLLLQAWEVLDTPLGAMLAPMLEPLLLQGFAASATADGFGGGSGGGGGGGGRTAATSATVPVVAAAAAAASGSGRGAGEAAVAAAAATAATTAAAAKEGGDDDDAQATAAVATAVAAAAAAAVGGSLEHLTLACPDGGGGDIKVPS